MSLMKIRQATINDYDQIMTILKDGANQLAERGVDQWQGEYPSPDQIKEEFKRVVNLIIDVYKDFNLFSINY